VECSELHANECPHFSNNGSCPYGDKCRLGHVHRASRMRKAARQSSEGRSSPEDTPKQESHNVVDTEAEAESWIGGATQDPHQFTQQVDFVSLNADE
jgi:hypothetical protein